jgi:uncharacterized protein (TIGR03437 family)
MAQFLHCSPTLIDFGLNSGPALISDTGGQQVRFKYAGVTIPSGFSNAPNFVLVIPSSGTTPAAVYISPNPIVAAQLAPGGVYRLNVLFTTVDQSPSSTVGCQVRFNVRRQPQPSIQSVVNAASQEPSLAPGAQVSIVGSYLTGPTMSTDYDATAFYPTSVAGTSVTFNGIPAPLLRLSPSKIRVIVPFALAGQTSVQVAVQRFDQTSDPFTVPLQDTAPGIFMTKHGSTGAGPIIQQGVDGQFTPNTADNPAPAGTTLKIFATGAGVWSPPPASDIFVYWMFGNIFFTTQPVSLAIGGQPAKISYAGTAGTYNTWSMLQVTATLPDGLSSGPQPVVLTIGANDNSQQQATIWVQ